MKRLSRRRLGWVLGALLLLWAEAAAALSSYEPSPRGLVGLSRPTISQQLVLDSGDRIMEAEMWLDGRRVFPDWDDSGLICYTPDEPLSPGEHTARLVVRVAPAQPGYFYDPIVSNLRFAVDQNAAASLPAAGPEQLRALARVNQYRVAAGLPALVHDDRLAAAAQRHARYLIANPDQAESDGHGERAGQPHFTGQSVGDRVRYYGYGGGAHEVINFVERAEEAVDGWIDTLYHRIPLLDPGMKAMGYGVAAGPPSRVVNVVETGPYDLTPGLVRWPYPGQVGVPPQWDGHEVPDPLDLYPNATRPLGYPITLTFGGLPRSLELAGGTLTGPDGETPVLHFSPANDPRLENAVAVIPAAPLRPSTRYTVRLWGKVDQGSGAVPFDHSWSFTTAPAPRPQFNSRVVFTSADGRALHSIQVEGTGFGPGMRLFLGGLPVEGLQVLSESRISFLPPQGYQGGPADLLAVTAGGTEAIWRSFFTGQEGYALPAAEAFVPLPVVVRGKPLTQRGLVHSSGALLLPEEALLALGATAIRTEEIGRTDWSLGDQAGEYTPGHAAAAVGGEPLLLAFPVQRLQQTTYVEAGFVRRLARVEIRMVDGQILVNSAELGMIDIAGHWARPAIGRLLAEGIVTGYGDGTFRPDATLTQAAFVKMLAAAKRLRLLPGDARGYGDAAGHWVAEQGYLGAAAAAGIVEPAAHPGQRFEPDRAITRGEMAAMAARAFGLEPSAFDGLRTDGGAVATRAEAAVVIASALDQQ